MKRISPAKRRAADADYDRVHAPLLRCFADLVAELGGDAPALMRAAGLDPVSSGDGAPRISYRQAVTLIEHSAAALGCPDFGMRLATRQGGDVYGPLGSVMRHSATFGDALDYVSTHTYAHSLAARVWIKRLRGGDGVFVGHDILLDRMPHRSQTMEQLLLVGHLSTLEITGGRARARRVHFRHLPISPRRTYRRYFGCEVRFGQNEDGIVYSDRDLASAIVASDAHAYRRAIAFIDTTFERQHPPLHAQVRGLVMQRLNGGDCTNARIAAGLGLHLRTLHRRLAAEGTSFQRIKDEVRRDLLLYYSRQTGLDFARISEQLGFAEQSVLTRNCRRWFAATPTGIRAQRHP
ncbi:MAG TPA: AraC family transcriptional regulator ligand-binding domain-containing protein [Solimonas sp.]|nr:AraC family transcriptional regulator ligand-binding domain-containing protein [Solimonas sp.]